MTTEERLEKLEKEIKEIRLHSRGTSILLCLSLLFIASTWLRESLHQPPKPPDYLRVKTITSQQFNLVDEQGKNLASLDQFQGEPSLHLIGNNDKSRIWLHMDKDGDASLLLNSEKGTASLGVAKDGEAALVLMNHGNKDVDSIASLNEYKDGRAAMNLTNTHGQAIASLGASKAEGPVMVIRDGSGKTKWSTP